MKMEVFEFFGVSCDFHYKDKIFSGFFSEEDDKWHLSETCVVLDKLEEVEYNVVKCAFKNFTKKEEVIEAGRSRKWGYVV